jgi:hypothetical protein
MYANCPDCETQLDQHSGICPACRWDPILSVEPIYGYEPESALAERYDVSDLVANWSTAAASRSPISRSRAVILFGLVSMATLYWVVLSLLGML